MAIRSCFVHTSIFDKCLPLFQVNILRKFNQDLVVKHLSQHDRIL